MAKSQIRNVAIVGASGNVGASLLKHLLRANQFRITIITRADSKATFPADSSIQVKRGAYDDARFLQTAFADQDAAVFALSFHGTNTQPVLIDAAAKAGVKWILPNEYGPDGVSKGVFEAVPILKPKIEARLQIERLAVDHPGLSWIGVITNPWVEQSIRRSLIKVNPYEKAAILYEDAGLFNMSTLDQVGLGMSRLLALPIKDDENPRASLQHYANNFVYMSSFSITQRELLTSCQRATGTSDVDWDIKHDSIKARVERDAAVMANGGPDAFVAQGDLLFAYYIGKGLGGDYQTKAVEDARVLGMQEEGLDAIVADAVKLGPLGWGA